MKTIKIIANNWNHQVFQCGYFPHTAHLVFTHTHTHMHKHYTLFTKLPCAPSPHSVCTPTQYVYTRRVCECVAHNRTNTLVVATLTNNKFTLHWHLQELILVRYKWEGNILKITWRGLCLISASNTRLPWSFHLSLSFYTSVSWDYLWQCGSWQIQRWIKP